VLTEAGRGLVRPMLSRNMDNTETGHVLERCRRRRPPTRRTTTSGTLDLVEIPGMKTHRIAILGGACLCASLLTADSAVAQTPDATTPVESTASRRDSSVDAAPTPDIDMAEAPAVRRVLEDEARHRDRVARITRLRDIYSRRDDRARLARLDDIERRELERHEARQVRERRDLSERTRRGVDDIVRRGGRFHANARDIAVARQSMRRADRRDGLDRRDERRDERRDRRSPRTTDSRPNAPASPSKNSDDIRRPR
jgi:hypothetical protein